MSHFTVLVIGDNPEDQLAGYHEFECTGYNDQYIVDVDQTDEVLATLKEYTDNTDYDNVEDPLREALEYYGLEDRIVEDEGEVDKADEHKFGYAVVKDGALVKAVRRTNPNAKWDWYLLGGRWTGFFKMKDGVAGNIGEPGLMTDIAESGYADQARLADIDIEGMRDEAAQKAGEHYDKIMEVIAGTEQNKSWDDLKTENPALSDDAIRTLYWDQPRCKAWQAHDYTKMFWRSSPEDYLISRDEHVANARKKAITTFAVVKDGEWYERGSMGWWGCVSNEKSDDEWIDQFSALFDNLPGDTLMSLYDCHI